MAQSRVPAGNPSHRPGRHALVPDQGRAGLAGSADLPDHLALRGPLGHRGLSPPVLPQDLPGGLARAPRSSSSSAPARWRTRCSTGAPTTASITPTWTTTAIPTTSPRGSGGRTWGGSSSRTSDPRSVVRDLDEDPLVRWQDKYYALIGIGVALGIPLIVGLLTGRVLGCLLIGGVLRIVVSHHGTFFINSLCHMVGTPPLQPRAQRARQPDHGRPRLRRGVPQLPPQLPLRLPQRRQGLALRPRQVDDLDALARSASPAISAAPPTPRSSRPRSRCSSSAPRSGCSRWSHDFREHHEARLHEAYASLQTALHELISLQRRQKPKAEAAAAGEEPAARDPRWA